MLRIRRLLVVAAMFALPAFGVGSAAAQGPACPQFSGDQAAAQAYFEANGGSATTNFNNMDADNNGVACDEPGAFEGGGPSAGASKCVTFAGDQVAAQEWFEANGGSAGNDYQRMDTNHNGIACDEPGAYQGGGPSAGPEDGPTAHSTECADYSTQEEAQTALENGAGRYDDLQLDTDGNGIACDGPEYTLADSASESGDDDTDGSDSVVLALPSTGSGVERGSSVFAVSLGGVSALLLAEAALANRRTVTGRQ